MEEYQIEMEKLFHKNQLIPRIRNEFEANPEFADHMDKNGIDQDFGYSLLVQMALHKRCNVSTLVGILKHHFQDDVQATADALHKAAEVNLVDWNGILMVFIMRFDISQDVQDDLDRYQYPLPMIVPPRILVDNHDTGYYTSRNSVILKNNHHDEDVCLDHLNKMNRIKLKVDQTTANMIENQWKNLDKPKAGEDRKDYQKRVKAFEKYDRTAKDVLQHLAINNSECYLTHKYDKRGRCYAQGYHFSYQGNAWNKAIVHFVNEEIVK